MEENAPSSQGHSVHFFQSPERRPISFGAFALERFPDDRIDSDPPLEDSSQAMPPVPARPKETQQRKKPPLTCGHKHPRCHFCQLCSYCGCDHDGLSVEAKTSRGVGKHGAVRASQDKVLKRATNTYVPGTFFESPMTPKAPNKVSASAVGPITRSAGHTTLATQLFRLPPPATVFRALDLEPLVQYFYKHAPPANKRGLASTWQEVDNGAVKVAVKVTQQAIDQLCYLLCNGDRASGKALGQLVARSTVHQGRDTAGVKVLENLVECYTKSQKQSVEKRVLRSCVAALKFSELKHHVSMPNQSYVRGREDLEELKQGNRLVQTKRSIRRYDEKAVNDAVAFMLSPEYVSYYSWGCKRLRVDGQPYAFPSIMHRQSRTHIYEAYVVHMAELPSAPTVKRSTFFKMLSALTDGESQQRNAIDYVVGFLVNDVSDLVERMILDLLPVGSGRQHLLQRLEDVTAYLKYGFDSQVRENENDCLLHHIQFGLGDRTSGCEHPRNSKCTSVCPPPTKKLCSDCLEIFRFFESLRAEMKHVHPHPSVLKVISNCEHKARLYLGHRIRVVNQQLAIQAKTNEVRLRCSSENSVDEAITVIDYKMKLEPIYYREKTVDHYGKRGISWHGSVVQSFERSSEEGERPAAPESRKLYYDHICNGVNKQDKEAVISILEALLIRAKADVPNIKRMTLQSDNATCYQNMYIPLILPFLSWIHGVDVSEFLHTETQDGKGIIDAHFARSMGVIRSWTREGHNCVTPTEAVIALKSHGGLPNTVVQLVDHNREKLAELINIVEGFDAKIRKYIKRANHVILKRQDTATLPDPSAGYASCPPFWITLFDYSGIGEGVQFVCDPAAGTCTLVTHSTPTSTSDENVEDEPTGDMDDEGLSNENALDEEAGSQVDDSGEEDCGDDEIELEVQIGPATGVAIATQGQVRRRTRKTTVVSMEVALEESAVITRDAIAQALREALRMQRVGDFVLRDPRKRTCTQHDNEEKENGDDEDEGRADGSEEVVASWHDFARGWATRPERGDMYGDRYVSNFTESIERLFRAGESDSSSKIGPGRMLEIIRAENPGRYDLPSENEIRQEISKLKRRSNQQQGRQSSATEALNVVEQPDGQSSAARVPSATPGQDGALTRHGIDVPATTATQTRKRPGRPRHPMTEFIERLLVQIPSLQPAASVNKIRAAFPDSDQTDAQLTRRFSAVKHNKRRSRNS